MTLQYQSFKGITKYDSVFRACCAAPMWPKTSIIADRISKNCIIVFDSIKWRKTAQIVILLNLTCSLYFK